MENVFIKNIYRILFTIILCALVISLKAGDIKVKSGDNKLSVKKNTYSELQLSNSFSLLSYRTVKTEKGIFSELSIPDYGTSMKIGDPKLPVLKKLIEIPVDAVPTVNIISYSLTEYKLSDYGIQYALMPSQPSVSKDIRKKLPEFKYNTSTYSANQFNSDDLVSIDVLGIMRNVRLARLNIAPVRYNPVTNTIQVYNDIQVEITFPGADITQTIELKKKNYSFYFESMFNNQLLNYKTPIAVKDTVTKYPVKYVIVSDPSFQTALQPFIQWKTKKGFKVIEAYTNNSSVGNTTTSIKNYLQGLYNAGTTSDPAPSFVLFVGDVAQVPAFAGTENGGGHVTDLYYCEYTGDFMPEMYYGRFSATTVAELQPQIDKTLEYEQYLMPDPSYLGKCDMISGQDESGVQYSLLQGDGQINYGTSTYFNTAHGLTSNTYLYATSGSSATQIIQDVSNGVCFANYTAHGSADGWYDPSFTISNISSLQNNHKYPLMVGNCCLTNSYDSDCFGEELLRASGKGAVGYIGGSNTSDWDEDFWFGTGYKTVVANPTYSASSLGAYDRTFHDHGEKFGDWYATQDQMIFAGNLAVTQSGSSLSTYYWEIYCLMGDPSLMIYYGVPPALTATYNALLPIGTNSFTVNTEPYAYIAVSMNGMLYGAALADSFGVATVPISLISIPGTADVVVTKQNRSPYIGTVTVASPSGPYVIYFSKLLHDVAGNNNGLADYSENITLDITLENVGASTASGVSAKLRSNDPYVTITDSTQSWGSITIGGSSTQSNAFAFTVADYVPDQHLAQFSLVITDGSNNWTGTFNVDLNSPKLSIGNISINDAMGNGNGILDPGETADLIISASNLGHSDATNTNSFLTLNAGTALINTGTSNLGLLNALTGTANATFNITVSPSAIIGSTVSFTDSLSSGLYSALKQFILMIGLVDEDWETGTFTKFHWVRGTYPWMIDSIAPFEKKYSAKSGDITNNQTSDLSITLDIISNDSISFYRRVSSESGYDFLNFYIDGTIKDTASGDGGGWTRVAVPVTTGIHTFKWSYSKDVSDSAGSDCAWIDYIVFPPINFSGISVPDMKSDNISLNCYPNPFTNSAFINYNLEKSGSVAIKIYDIMGQEVATVVNEKNKQAGNYLITFNAEKLNTGIYNCIMITKNKIITKKIIISR